MMHRTPLSLALAGLLLAGPTCNANDDADAGGTDDTTDVGAESPADIGGDSPADPGAHDVVQDVPLESWADTPPGDTSTETGEDAADLPWPDGRYISIEEVHRRREADDPEMLLLNVSDEEFYSLGHLPGTLAIPWDLLPGRIGDVDRSRHVVIYCRRGVRSEAAFETLHGAGYPMLWIMEGGIEGWTAAGYATVPCEDPSVTCP